MKILNPFAMLSITTITAQTCVPTEGNMPKVADTICDKACYNTYRYFMGDYHTSEDWLDHAVSHQYSADQICAAELCSDCPFCNVHQDIYDNTLNLKISLANRRNAHHDKVVSCFNCQEYVDSCQVSLQQHALHDRVDLDCQLKVCTRGPMHCRAGGQCERRICKDLVARTSKSPPSEPDCKQCTSLWARYVHARCFPPNQDCFTTPCAAPHPTCAALWWSITPTNCQKGHWCGHPIYAKMRIASHTYPLTDEAMISSNQSSSCNAFREECLGSCSIRELRATCKDACVSKWRVNGARKKLCRGECDQKISCHQYCREKTCCVGPAHCRLTGSHYRCGDIANLQCDYRKGVSSCLSP